VLYNKLAMWTLHASNIRIVEYNWWGFNPTMPMFRAFDSWRERGRLADSTASDRNRGTHKVTQVWPPEGNDLHPACLILYCLYTWCCYNGAQMGSGYGRKEMVCASLSVGSMRDQVSMRDCPSRGRPWWLYICSWYVSNVSIIFDAPCLFLHHLPNVSLHLVAFLYIFWN
jgi:hypothetical protein